MVQAAADDETMGRSQPVTLPRSSKRPRFQTQSLDESDDEEGSGVRWEGTGGLLQFLNSGDELTLTTENSKWRVWTSQTAGTQYAEPALAAAADSAAIDSKDVSKKFVQRCSLFDVSLLILARAQVRRAGHWAAGPQRVQEPERLPQLAEEGLDYAEYFRW
jgi:hypothetical protein